MTLISVVIPSYNAAKWLPETIDSVLKQTHQETEIIIVDDHSTDNTKEVVDRYIQKFGESKIQYSRNEKNLGECITSRRGFEAAKGEYICRLSADDMYFDILKLENQYEYMELVQADWSYDASYLRGTSITDSKIIDTYWLPPIIPIPFPKWRLFLQRFDNWVLSHPWLAFLLILKNCPINSSTLMFSRKSYLRHTKWSDEHRSNCDGHLLYNLLLEGTKGVAMHNSLGALYRTHPDQMSYSVVYIIDIHRVREKIFKKVEGGDYPLWFKVATKIASWSIL